MMVPAIGRAHAFIDSAEPAVGSTVAAPEQVQLVMTRKLKPGQSQVQVFDATGKEVDRLDVKVEDFTMTVSLPKLSSGTYTVHWKAVCRGDGHTTTGTFPFTVK